MDLELQSLLDRFESHVFVNKYAAELFRKAEELEDDAPEDALVVFRKIAMRIDQMPIIPTREKLNIFRKASDLGRKIGDHKTHFDQRTAQLFREDGNQSVAGVYFEHAAEAWSLEDYPGDHDKDWIIKCSLLMEAQMCFQAAGRGNEASRCFVKCRKTERDNLKGWRKANAWFGYLFWKWGESPTRVALWAAMVILLFSLGHFYTGLTNTDGLLTFGTALYFSVVTFTTLGFGDYAPATGFGRFLAGTEALLGIFFTGLFLVTFVKRFTR